MQQANLGDGVATARLLSRSDWGARLPKSVEHFQGPAPYVIIHHSYMPAVCYSTPDCMKSMRDMQDFHQLERGWNDIGYSFGIGGDGMIYTGRGFNVIGAHAPKYNDKSVGIVLVGDWRSKLTPNFKRIDFFLIPFKESWKLIRLLMSLLPSLHFLLKLRTNYFSLFSL